jgi:hypothetical protein
VTPPDKALGSAERVPWAEPMSYVVDVFLSIPCGGPKSVAATSGTRLSTLRAESMARAAVEGEASRYDQPRGWAETEWLLEHLAAHRGFASGGMGCSFSWGIRENSTDVAVFVDVLRPFWQELLRWRRQEEERDWDGPLSVSQIVLLCDGEGFDHGYALTIRNADPWRVFDPHPALIVDHHALPFSLYCAKPPRPPTGTVLPRQLGPQAI